MRCVAVPGSYSSALFEAGLIQPVQKEAKEKLSRVPRERRKEKESKPTSAAADHPAAALNGVT